MGLSYVRRAWKRAIPNPRREGDAARERRDWRGAAIAYRRHLDRHPDAFPIWVQLGHMLKEAGDLDAALASYSRARDLRPDDPDLLLSLGHLHKRRGETLAAMQSYDASLAHSDGDRGDAACELDALAFAYPAVAAEHWPPTAQDERLGPCVTSIAAGLHVTGSGGITLLGDDGRMASQTSNPWIEFAPLLDDCETSVPVAILEIAFDDEAGVVPENSQVQIDHGSGYEDARATLIGDGSTVLRLLVAMPATVRAIRWSPGRRPFRFGVSSIALRPLIDASAWRSAFASLGRSELETAQGMATLERIRDRKPGPALAATVQRRLHVTVDPAHDYESWTETYVTPQGDDHSRIATMINAMTIRPRFSFVMPTYETSIDLLVECIEAMRGQSYPDFEICIADDNSPDPAVAALLRDYAARDPRIKICLRTENGHISAASNSALALATGDFIVLVDHDDLIPNYTLATVAWYVNRHPDAAVLYSDEDKIDVHGFRSAPHFKGEFSKFLMYGHNMISHLGVYRRALIDQIGGFRLGVEGSQDYDLFLRCYERVGDAGVVHIPHVLYHWRMVPGSTAVSADQKSYAAIAAQAAINGYFDRNGVPLRSVTGLVPGLTAVAPVQDRSTPISIIIPTRDGVDVLRRCIDSIFAADPHDIEILILDNESRDRATLHYLEALAADRNEVRVIPYRQAFNFSAINNFGAAQAAGEVLCFLNDDTEVLDATWLDRARMLLALPDVGLVGARLLFPDGDLQHFGIGLGMGVHGVAGTPYAGFPGHDPGYFGKARLMQDVSAATGACLFTRKVDFDAVGGFDPALRVAYNDVDLCLRYREAGWRIVVDPSIELLHRESRSRGSDKAGANADRLEREAQLMRDRWGAILAHDPFLSPNLSLARSDFALAYPPRQQMPWRRDAKD